MTERRDMDEGTFRRAFAAILEHHAEAFQALADYDRGIVRGPADPDNVESDKKPTP